MAGWCIFMSKTSPTPAMVPLSAPGRNIPDPSISGCRSGSHRTWKMSCAGASIRRDADTVLGASSLMAPLPRSSPAERTGEVEAEVRHRQSVGIPVEDGAHVHARGRGVHQGDEEPD